MKKNTWRNDLSRYLLSVRGKPFEWGQHDCCLFVCDAIQVMTGIDVSKNLKGKYNSAKGAQKILLKLNSNTLEALFKRCFKASKTHTPLNFGDLALVDQDGIIAAGVVSYQGVWVLTLQKLELLSFEQIVKAYDVNDLAIREPICLQ